MNLVEGLMFCENCRITQVVVHMDSVYLPEMTPKMCEDIEDNGGL